MAKRKVESKEWFETAFIPTGTYHQIAGWKHKVFGYNRIFDYLANIGIQQ